MYLTSRYSSIPYFEPSRPMPDSFTAAERRDLGGDQPGVDADDAVFERFGDPPDAPDVAPVEYAARPNSVSLASGWRPLRCRTLNSGATGPNVSSRATAIVRCAPSALSARRSVPPSAWRWPPTQHRRALRHRVGDVALDLLDGRDRR